MGFFYTWQDDALSCMGCGHRRSLSCAGLHASIPLKSSLNARIGINGLSYSTEDSTDDVDYDLKLKLATVDALVDYFPMEGAFRLTTGIVYNNNAFEVTGRPKGNQTYTFNGRTYAAAAVGSVVGDVTFNKVLPCLGIGWGNAAADKGWGLSSDIGVIFQGKPKSSLSNRGCTATAPVCAQIASDIRRKRFAARRDGRVQGAAGDPRRRQLQVLM